MLTLVLSPRQRHDHAPNALNRVGAMWRNPVQRLINPLSLKPPPLLPLLIPRQKRPAPRENPRLMLAVVTQAATVRPPQNNPGPPRIRSGVARR